METYLEVFKWEGSDIRKISEDFIYFEIEYVKIQYVFYMYMLYTNLYLYNHSVRFVKSVQNQN